MRKDVQTRFYWDKAHLSYRLFYKRLEYEPSYLWNYKVWDKKDIIQIKGRR